MKPSPFQPIHFWHRLFLLLLAGTLLGIAGPQPTGGRKSLELKLSDDRRSAKVAVPDGVVTVTLQRFQRDGGWTRVAVRDAVPGMMRFKLPSGLADGRWRAIGRFKSPDVRHDKFPAAFYQGKKSFGPEKSKTGGAKGLSRFDESAIDGGNPAGLPVEADIWKVDGNTVYFFNQLRGLQVLDLANPADPRITASLRLPAMGQDLYLLPGTGPERHLVLLTEEWSNQSGEQTTINLVKVSGGQAEITHRQKVKGYLADSRMAGKRLILATTEWNWSGNKSDDWTSSTSLTEWLVAPGTSPKAAGKTVIEGDGPLIAAGSDWLALAVHPTGRWDVSDVSIFALRPGGLVRMAPVFRTEGSIGGKFAMQWSDNVLTTVSEKNTSKNGWSPSTVLENFRAWSPDVVHPLVFEERIGRLQLAKGESLFATRFAGDKAYIVTFLQTDPLFVVDLSNPADPKVAGEIKVPGWSTHLEPLGDLLFAIGWESNTAVASLFDVAAPAAPKLLRRIKLGAEGTYSEALWDEKALKFLPDAGLAMVPLASYYGKSGESRSVVQLMDVDTSARDIRLRGTISHDFDARRADLMGDAVVSISQRVMVAADVTNRDAPSILSEVSLAWPVDRVFEAGGHLLQIEDGSWYGGGRATLRVSPAGATEQILAEFDLGKGNVKAADHRKGKLYVLRETESSGYFSIRRASVVDASEPSNKLILDIYDASALPELILLGSHAVRLPDGGHVTTDHILWPQPNRPSVLVDFSYSFWYEGSIFDSNRSTSLAAAAAPLKSKSKVRTDIRPYWVPEKSARLIVFDTTDPQEPSVDAPVVLGPDGSVFNGLAEAADGLIVMGNSQWMDPANKNWFKPGVALQSVRVVEVESSGSPLLRPLIDLPGELLAVTELDRNGFLAFTRTPQKGKSSEIQASACDGYEAYFIASLEAPAYGAATAGGRRLFVANKDGVERHLLTNDGEFTAETPLESGWMPDSLRWIDGILIGARWNALFLADDASTDLTKWKFPTWNPGVDRVVPTANGGLLVPFGEYGVERLER